MVQGFGVLQGLFGSKQNAPPRGGFGLSVHFAWDNGTSLGAGYVQGRGDGIAPSAIYIGGPDYHIGRETVDQSYSRPPIPNREMVPSPWPWLWEKLKQEWTEAELANEAHRRGEDWLTDECFLYEDGKYDKPLRHLGKRDASGKFCDVGGQLVPMDAPLRAVGSDLMPVSPPSGPQPNPPAAPAIPIRSSATTPTASEPSAAAPHKSKKHRDRYEQKHPASEFRSPQTDQVATAPVALTRPPEANPSSPSFPVRRERPGLGESAAEFARGFAVGVGEESWQIYHDTKELPDRLAKTGRELVEDLQAGRELRALAPLLAMERAVRNASREDVERVAHGVIAATKDWLDKPAYEKGESLGRATTSLAADAAIGVLTEGLGTLGTLRKIERTADAADHVRDAERVLERAVGPGQRLERVLEQTEAAIPGRRGAMQSAKERAGVPRSQSPDRQWTVGPDGSRAGHSNYRLSDDPASHGRYYEYETASGTRVVVEHTSDPRAPAAHFHAGQPKGDSARTGVDFKSERYQQVDGKHHIYYKK